MLHLCVVNERQKEKINTNNLKILVMRTQLNNLLVELNEVELLHLINQVKETVAVEHATPKTKANFCAADLWKIQKMHRTRTQRRELFL